MKLFLGVLILTAVLGGFVGGEILHKSFSITGAVIGCVGTGAILLGLGAYFDAEERKKGNLPPEVTAIFDRMVTGKKNPTQSEMAEAKNNYRGNRQQKTVQSPTLQERARIIDLLGTLISMGSLSLPPLNPALKDRCTEIAANKKAQGYLFGFHDAFLVELRRLDNDSSVILSIIKDSYVNLFGTREGIRIFENAMDLQSDNEFRIGRQSGGDDLLGYVEKKTPPLGLSRILDFGLNG